MELAQLKAAAEQFAAAHEEEIIADMARLVAVRSVRGEEAPGAPFGAGPRAALLEGLAIAGERGLRTEDCTTVGRAFLPGESGKSIGIVAHVDVVPEGSGWDSDPYTLTEREGWLIGRGISDDKGPAILAIWAARFFALRPQAPRHTIEVLLGSDEERGMGDLPPYLASHPAPDFTFTPDGAFPIGNGEKGQSSGDFVSAPLGGGLLVDFGGGVATNVVPDRAWAVVRARPEQLPQAAGVTVTAAPEGARIEAVGKAAHASTPAGSRSAIGMVAALLLESGLGSTAERAALTLVQTLATDPDGSKLGIASADPTGAFTPLTIIGGMVRMENGALVQNFDTRFPPSTSGEAISRALAARAAAAGCRLENVKIDPPFYIAADSAPILALRETYTAVTGKPGDPFTMGGGTYARHLPRAVSFGIEEEDMTFPPFAGTMHAANEAFPRKNLMRDLVIFICALGRLMETEL